MPALTPGELVPICDHVWRVLCGNPGMMTGPGTNTYLVGKQSLAVIDPGPVDDRHCHAILSAAESLGKPISNIMVTHTHRDHSPGAHALCAVTGAELLGPSAPQDGLQDELWQVKQPLVDGDHIDAGGVPLHVLHTPGHVGNHLCYLTPDGLLFTGDHLIQGSTVVIAPPSGSMSAYMQSLRKLTAYTLTHIAPGHGDIISDPQALIKKTLLHRQQREDKVWDALGSTPERLDQLVKRVYDDVPEFLHGVAQLSLQAHLIKLQEEHRAQFDLEGWHRADGY